MSRLTPFNGASCFRLAPVRRVSLFAFPFACQALLLDSLLIIRHRVCFWRRLFFRRSSEGKWTDFGSAYSKVNRFRFTCLIRCCIGSLQPMRFIVASLAASWWYYVNLAALPMFPGLRPVLCRLPIIVEISTVTALEEFNCTLNHHYRKCWNCTNNRHNGTIWAAAVNRKEKQTFAHPPFPFWKTPDFSCFSMWK